MVNRECGRVMVVQSRLSSRRLKYSQLACLCDKGEEEDEERRGRLTSENMQCLDFNLLIAPSSARTHTHYDKAKLRFTK